MRRAIWLILFAFLLPSCNLARPFLWNLKIRAADERVARKIEKLHLASLKTPAMKPLELRTQVVVMMGGIDVYNVALVAGWWNSELRPVARSLGKGFVDQLLVEQEQVVVLSEGKLKVSDLRDGADGFMVEPLYEVLRKAFDIERSYSDFAAKTFKDVDHSPGRLSVLIEKNVPYETAAKVLYSAGQAEYSSYDLVAEGPDGLQAIPLEAPRFCETESDGKAEDLPDSKLKKSILAALGSSGYDGPTCAQPAMHIGPKGIMVAAMSGSPNPGCKLAKKQEPTGLKIDAEAAKQDYMPIWHDKVMLGPQKACPSVPRQNGKLDLAGLRHLLIDMKMMAPGCREALISASPEIRWEEVISVMETAMVDCAFDRLLLAVIPGFKEDPEACAQGLQPSRFQQGTP